MKKNKHTTYAYFSIEYIRLAYIIKHAKINIRTKFFENPGYIYEFLFGIVIHSSASTLSKRSMLIINVGKLQTIYLLCMNDSW